MSDDKNETEERYIDPNSGLAPQPGGFVAGGASNPVPDPEPEAVEAEEDSPADPDAEDNGGGDGGDTPPAEEKDYSELLAGNVGPVQDYLDEHADEADAVKAAEVARAQAAGEDPRKGIVNH